MFGRLKLKQAPSWEELAIEVESLSDRRLKALWPKRYLPAIQGIDGGKMFPGFIKLFSEDAANSDWAGIRELLPTFFIEVGKLKIPPPKF
jgi:hypothetical protein